MHGDARTFRRLLLPLSLVALALWSTPAAAQTGVVVDGCLTDGPRPGFFIVEGQGDKPVTAMGHPELSTHVGHRVRLTGAYEGQDIFRVRQIEMTDDACEPVLGRIQQSVRSLVRRFRRKATFGFLGGVALDPELVVVGGHAEFATGVANLRFRPGIEIGFGEVSTFYALNLDALYRLPVVREREGRSDTWHLYVGGGPSAAVVSQEFREIDVNRVDPGDFVFDDTDTEIGFNLLAGVATQSGLSTELRAGGYGNPAIRVLAGYTF